MKHQHIIPLATGFAAFSLFGLPLATYSNENDSARNSPPPLFTTPTDDRGQIDAHGMPVERPVADRQNMEKPLDSSEVVGADILTHGGKEVGTVRDVSDIAGADIRTAEDQKIGSVDQVYLNIGSGTVAGLVISADQIPELEKDKIVLGLMELEYNADDNTFIVHYTIDELRNAPRFIEGDYNVFQNIRTRMSMLLR